MAWAVVERRTTATTRRGYGPDTSVPKYVRYMGDSDAGGRVTGNRELGDSTAGSWGTGFREMGDSGPMQETVNVRDIGDAGASSSSDALEDDLSHG
jgi:hypothetical protein